MEPTSVQTSHEGENRRPLCKISKLSLTLNVTVIMALIASLPLGAGIAQWLEHRTRD